MCVLLPPGDRVFGAASGLDGIFVIHTFSAGPQTRCTAEYTSVRLRFKGRCVFPWWKTSKCILGTAMVAFGHILRHASEKTGCRCAEHILGFCFMLESVFNALESFMASPYNK